MSVLQRLDALETNNNVQRNHERLQSRVLTTQITHVPHQLSGIVRLGHTGARALATRGRAHQCMRIIGADGNAVDRESAVQVSDCNFDPTPAEMLLFTTKKRRF